MELGININELKQQPDLVSPFVSAVIKIVDNMAEEVLIGISGLEIYFSGFKSPLHTKKQVNQARDLILVILQKNKMLSKGYKLRMIYK